MTTVTVRQLTIQEAKQRRDEIVRELGGDLEAIAERAESYLLTLKERALFDEWEDLQYLLSK